MTSRKKTAVSSRSTAGAKGERSTATSLSIEANAKGSITERRMFRAKKKLERRMPESAYYKPRKKQITLRLDEDVVAWFKSQGRRYQTMMNIVLRLEMMESINPDRPRK